MVNRSPGVWPVGTMVRLNSAGREHMDTRDPNRLGRVLGGTNVRLGLSIKWEGRRWPEPLHIRFLERVKGETSPEIGAGLAQRALA